MTNNEYLINLDNKGGTRRIKILEKPYYPYISKTSASTQYKPLQDILSDDNVLSYDDDPHTLYDPYIGFIRDEGTLFQIFRSLKTPILKLEKM